MTTWVNIFIGLLFFAYVGKHQVRILAFDNYQTSPVPLKDLISLSEIVIIIINLWLMN